MAEKILTFNGKTISGPNGGGGMVVLKTPPFYGDGVTIGGRTYPTVIIGNQEWLAENLDFAWDGLPVPTSTARTKNTPQAMYYNYDESTYGWDGYKCGLLYNWYAVKYLEDNKSTLIPGWHVPTKSEYESLKTAIESGGSTNTAGTKLKAKDNTAASNWPSGWNGTDDYGFNVLPAGRYDDFWETIGIYAQIWAASEMDDKYAHLVFFNKNWTTMDFADNYKIQQSSVRLVRDAT